MRSRGRSWKSSWSRSQQLIASGRFADCHLVGINSRDDEGNGNANMTTEGGDGDLAVLPSDGRWKRDPGVLEYVDGSAEWKGATGRQAKSREFTFGSGKGRGNLAN